MGLLDDFEDEWPDLLTEHGRSVTHRPAGDSASDVAVTVAFINRDSRSDHRKDSSTGEARISECTIQASESLSVASGDQFVIDSEVWSVKQVSPAQGGRQLATVQRVDEDRRNTRMRGMR